MVTDKEQQIGLECLGLDHFCSNLGFWGNRGGFQLFVLSSLSPKQMSKLSSRKGSGLQAYGLEPWGLRLYQEMSHRRMWEFRQTQGDRGLKV